MSTTDHWQTVYSNKSETDLSWFQADPMMSFELIEAYAQAGQPIVDVGGGASRLVDRLLAAKFGPVTVLDLSDAALSQSRCRLDDAADAVHWVVCDVTEWAADRPYQVWHDRAVFHFLTEPELQKAYVSRMDHALLPGGVAIIATFALDGPEKCSGLPVQRYSGESLTQKIEEYAPGQFARLKTVHQTHTTPKGASQEFQISVFRKQE